MEKVTGKQQQVIELLISGQSQSEAAKVVDCSREQINRWLNSRKYPEFVACYNSARIATASDSAQRLDSLYTRACDLLFDIFDNGGDDIEPMQARVALAIFKNGQLADVGKLETNSDRLKNQWAKDERIADMLDLSIF